MYRFPYSHALADCSANTISSCYLTSCHEVAELFADGNSTVHVTYEPRLVNQWVEIYSAPPVNKRKKLTYSNDSKKKTTTQVSPTR